MSFDLNKTLEDMLAAAKAVFADEWPDVKDDMQRVLNDEKEALKDISEADSVPQVITTLEGTSYYDSLKNAIEDYTNEGSVQFFENALDSHYLELVRDLSTQNYVSIGPTLRFIISKEFEIKNLKIIVKGIGEGLTSEFIRPLLVLEATKWN